MKRSKQCPKCASGRIGYIAEQVDADQLTSDGVTTQPTPRAIGASAEQQFTGFFKGGWVYELIGRLEAYVCADCGYHETYVKNPDGVPWDRIGGFTWVNPATVDAGPFR
jgi:hypothetical protein